MLSACLRRCRINGTGMNPPLQDLVAVLRLAYSGERAAAYAYRGHWKSVRDAATRSRIREIEEEEWHHRRLVGDMLERLSRKPDVIRELRALVVGRTLGVLCHLTGWLAPMYAAGKLESRNIREYEAAARFAARAGHPEFVDCLLAMAETEWEHEKYFRSCVLSHRWSSRLRMWVIPPGKEEIRRSFEAELLFVESA